VVLPLENHSTDRYSPNTGSFASILIPIGYDVGQPRAVIRAPAQMLQAVVFMSRLRWKLPEPIRSEVTFRETRRSTLGRPPITTPRQAGSVPCKEGNPALPVLPAEQIESTQAVYDDRAHSGSSIAPGRRRRPAARCQ
jgi:hypothetical protein